MVIRRRIKEMFAKVWGRFSAGYDWRLLASIMIVLAVVSIVVMGIYGFFDFSRRAEQWREKPASKAKINAAMENWLVDWVYTHSERISRRQCREIVQGVAETELPRLILSIIELESVRFMPGALSSQGAIGWCQINVKQHGEELIKAGIIREIRDLWDILPNIRAGEFILKQKFVKSKGSVKGALEGYLGKHDKDYLLRILSNYADLCVEMERENYKIIKNLRKEVEKDGEQSK
jgi:hypothetical protein